jgi:hypothetical protein
MRHLFTIAAATMAAMPAFLAGIAVAISLGFHDGDEAKTMSIAIAFAFLAALGATLGAPRGFARIPVRWQPAAAMLGLAVAMPLFVAFLLAVAH